MKERMSYVPLEMAEDFEDFIITKDEQILDSVRAKARDYNTFSLLKLLHPLRQNPRTFSDLYSKSRIRMKKSFLRYLHLCLDYEFVTKESKKPYMIYTITEKGITMLELFMQKDSLSHGTDYY